MINLAGAPVADRPWTQARKALLWESRVSLTEELVRWLGARSQRPMFTNAASAAPAAGGHGTTSRTGAASPGRLVVQDDAKAARQAGHPSPRRADPMGASPLFGLSYRKLMVGPPPPPGPAPAPATETVAARSSTTVPLRP